MEVRLATHLWVGAYLARLSAEGIFAHLICRGDATAGAVIVKLAFMDGRASLFGRVHDLSGGLVWEEEQCLAPEAEVDAAIARRRSRDRDVWVIEVEDPRGRHMLGEPGI
ncbi:MAG: DUF1491 family protein [Pseudomonadota bacterium]